MQKQMVHNLDMVLNRDIWGCIFRITTLSLLLFSLSHHLTHSPHKTSATWQITISSEEIYAGLGVPASWSLSEMAEPISPDSLLSGPCLSLKVRWLSAKSFSCAGDFFLQFPEGVSCMKWKWKKKKKKRLCLPKDKVAPTWPPLL